MPRNQTLDLFAATGDTNPRTESLGDGAAVLRAFAMAHEAALLEAVGAIAAIAPFRHLITPGGFRMSVAMTNCGPLGWVSDRSGYRYDPVDPQTGRPWPALPEVFRVLALRAAAAVGFANYVPDACLINRYEPGARLALHQDRDERDRVSPIVSVSMGLPATFLFGGDSRAERPSRIPLRHGDVVVWGGPARFRYHGVLPVVDGEHRLLGRQRINFTFRKVM